MKKRQQLGLNQTQLASIIGITKQGYSLIENNRRNPSWKTQQRLEQIFGIPASELLAEGDDSEDSTSYISTIVAAK